MQSIYLVACRVIVLFLASLMGLSVHSQITADKAFYTEPTEYGGGVVEDPIFFYENISDAVLNAPAGLNYQWYRYSTSSNSFEMLSGATASFINNISESGYCVDVDGNRFYCWNFEPLMQIDSIGTTAAKDACDDLRLTAYITKQLVYYNHHRTDTPSREVDYGFIWSSSPTGPIEGKTGNSHKIDAPFEDVAYSVIVGEKFSPTLTPVEEELEYSAIAVEAKFSHEVEGTADNEATEGSAPMVVRFTDESKGNVTDWEWTFGEAGKDFVPDPIFTFQKFVEGGYPVVLKVTNIISDNLRCESETAPEVFTVNEMVVKAPNAFTPFSSPGQNDEFRVLYRSVNKFSMLIYNRWGRKVYSSSNPEEGWDGKIGNQKAEPGVYFYKIEATGFNPKEVKKLEGAVHLMVTNN